MRTINLMILMAEVLMVPAWGVEATPYWPQFHGPLRNNLSTETGLLKQWSPEGPPLKWTARGIGQGYSSVSLAYNRIYTSGNINGKTVISALDLAGKTAWQETIGDGWVSKKNYPGTRATPTLLGKRLFYMSPIGDLVCLDALSGKKIWGFSVLERFNSQPPRWGLAESIVIYDGRVFCCPGGPETAVVALDLETGEVLWKSPSTGDLAGYATVTVAEYKGVPMIIAMTAKAVIGVHAGNGELLWRYAHETPYDMNVQRPVYHRGRVLISSVKTGAVMLEIEVRDGACSVKPVWTSTDLDNHHGGVTLLDGYVYGSCWHRGWSCLEWETGKTMYHERNLAKGSLTYADGHFYMLSEKRKMSLVKAVPQAYEAVSEFPLPDAGQGFSWARPVVCGGILYIRHDDFLYAYDVREPARNMLKNPSFESGDENWKPMGPATSIVPDSAYAEDGTQCLKIVLDPNRYKQQRYQDVKGVQPGDTLNFRCRMKTEGVQGRVTVVLKFWTRGNAKRQFVFVTPGWAKGTSDWQEYRKDGITVPDDFDGWFQVVCFEQVNKGPGIAYWDDLYLEKVGAAAGNNLVKNQEVISCSEDVSQHFPHQPVILQNGLSREQLPEPMRKLHTSSMMMIRIKPNKSAQQAPQSINNFRRFNHANKVPQCHTPVLPADDADLGAAAGHHQ